MWFFFKGIFSKGRVGGGLSGFWSGPIALATMIGIAAHNIATLNPDFEIARNVATNNITVTYKK
jgi:hypothetical protein